MLYTSIPKSGYSFDAVNKEITFIAPYDTIELGQISLITNCVTGDIIFQFQKVGKLATGGTITGSVLTLDFDTSGMNNSDELKFDIKFEDGSVSLGLTDAELRASPVPVSGTVTANTGLSQPLTDAQLRASAVPVSAASLPLPTGAATLTEQQSQTTKLTSLDGKDFATQTTLATRLSESDFDVKVGELTETAPATDIASSGLNGRLQRIAQRLTSLINLLPSALVGGRLDVNVGKRIASTPTKTGGNTLVSLQSVAASSVLVSSVVDVSTKWKAGINVFFGRRSATAAGAGVNIYIEGSTFAAGDDNWATLAQYTTGFAAAEAEAVTGTVSAGATVITCASTTNLTAQDYIYIDNGTIANSEWRRIKSIVANTSVTVIDALTNAQTGSTMYDSAETYTADLDLSGYMRLRILVDGSLFTQAFAIKVTGSYMDSIV